MTVACADCYAAVIVCTIKNCVADCVADAAAPACLACQETNGCRTPFYPCSGFKPAT